MSSEHFTDMLNINVLVTCHLHKLPAYPHYVKGFSEACLITIWIFIYVQPVTACLSRYFRVFCFNTVFQTLPGTRLDCKKSGPKYTVCFLCKNVLQSSAQAHIRLQQSHSKLNCKIPTLCAPVIIPSLRAMPQKDLLVLVACWFAVVASAPSFTSCKPT